MTIVEACGPQLPNALRRPTGAAMKRLRSANDRNGFSLIEALVALAILGAVASVALTIVSGAADRHARASARARAIFAAETLLGRVGLDIALARQTLTGTLPDGAAWELVVSPFWEVGLPENGVDDLMRVEVGRRLEG